MKKNILIFTGILVLIFTMSFGTLAVSLNDVVTVPTADITGYQGLISSSVNSDTAEIEGIYRLNSNLEVGGVLDFYDKPFEDNNELGPVVKLLLSPEKGNTPAVAAGIENEAMYLVLSKDLGYGWHTHMGVGNENYDGFFVGVNKVINPEVNVNISENEDSTAEKDSSMPPMKLMAEYVNKDINLGLRMNLKNSIYLDFGVLDLDKFQAGVSVGF